MIRDAIAAARLRGDQRHALRLSLFLMHFCREHPDSGTDVGHAARRTEGGSRTVPAKAQAAHRVPTMPMTMRLSSVTPDQSGRAEPARRQAALPISLAASGHPSFIVRSCAPP